MAGWPSKLEEIAQISAWIITEPTPFRDVEFGWDGWTQGRGVWASGSLKFRVKSDELGG